MLRRLFTRLTRGASPSDAEIARELQDHLDLDAESLAAHHRVASSNPRYDARQRFGNVTNVGESVHDVWHSVWLEQLAQDIRHSVRAIVRSPAYSAAIVITLAMGIGASAAIYSLSNAIHRPFPLLPQDKLLWITQTNAACGVDCTEISPAALVALQTRAPSLATAVGVTSWQTALRGANGSELVSGFQLSPGTFSAIDAPFAAGHGFPADAEHPGGPRFVVLSYDLWHRRFGGSRGVLDSAVTLGGVPYHVSGVLARNVVFPMTADVYAPLVSTASDASNYASRRLLAFARIAPGATFAAAANAVETIGAQLKHESPATDSAWTLRARPIADFHTDDVAILERIAGIAALLVFLAACMSAANLALARVSARRHELALRTALGVGRGRLARHLLTESLLLSLIAGAFGALLARWGVRAIRDAIPASFSAFVPGWALIRLDARTLAFTFVAAVVAMLAFAALPVLRGTRVSISGILSDGGRASTGSAQSARTRATLIVLEVSIALVLLTAATLFTRSVRNMMVGDAGVRLDHALVMQLTIPPALTDSTMIDFYRQLDENFRMERGIRAGGAATTTPLSNNFSSTAFAIPGRAPELNGRKLSGIDQHITPGYAEAAGMKLIAGRMLGAQDVAGAQRALVVNQMMADAYWPHASAIGRLVIIDSVPWTVVGVAQNVHHAGLDEPMRNTFYRSLYQSPVPHGVVAVWTSADADAMRDVVRGVVARTDPSVAVGDMMTMDQMQARHVSAFSMMAGILAVLAVVTMTIATVGLYGLIAYGVAQRTREIGVRIALGARRRDILSQVGGGAVRLTMLGVVIGIVGAVLFARVLAVMLYGVSTSDPRTYIGVSVGLLAIALTAALVPSWRAARIEPTIALRE